MKKFLVFIFFIIFCQTFVYGQLSSVTTQNLVAPQDVSFEDCTKIFNINEEKLFYLTLASISANRFLVEEVQTANGYIIFSANKNNYLATIAEIDSQNSILKITPCNNVYNFPLGILTNMFKYIEMNVNLQI